MIDINLDYLGKLVCEFIFRRVLIMFKEEKEG